MNTVAKQAVPGRGVVRLDNINRDLSKFRVASADLASTYWSPAKEGETKLLTFVAIEVREAPDYNDADKIVHLEHAIFSEFKNGVATTVVSAAKVLVGILKETPQPPGTPLKVVYLGTEKNKKNSHRSSRWQVFLLEDGAQ